MGFGMDISVPLCINCNNFGTLASTDLSTQGCVIDGELSARPLIYSALGSVHTACGGCRRGDTQKTAAGLRQKVETDSTSGET